MVILQNTMLAGGAIHRVTSRVRLGLSVRRSMSGMGPVASWEKLDSSQVKEIMDTPMLPTTKDLATRLLEHNRVALSRAITLIESTKLSHHVQAQHLLAQALQEKAKNEKAELRSKGSVSSNMLSKVPQTLRVGIAGPPGAGKSTFIEALGMMLVNQGHKVAVIAVDPSSSRSGGSILGDKTRMNLLAVQPNAFVRPSPSRGYLGGIAQHTNDVVLLCEAGGYDIVIVETVGLGQSEIMVDDTVDFLMLLVPPAGGDELQGVKKGIMEVADMVVVNKADGDLLKPAKRASVEYMHAFQVFRPKRVGWHPPVKLCSAIKKENIDGVWEVIEKFQTQMNETGEIARRRTQQSRQWMWSELAMQLLSRTRTDPEVIANADVLERELALGHTTPREAARQLIDTFMNSTNNKH